MPLMHGKSRKAFSHNVETEMEHGHPQKQSVAIAYAMQRKGKKKAHGGYMADGGFIEEEEEKSGYRPLPHEQPEMNERAEEEDDDMIGQIMREKRKMYSEGGRVANQEHGQDDEDLAGFSPNEFDDLVLDDDLDQHYTGANSGDEIGNAREDEDQDDMIRQIMREKKMKSGRYPASIRPGL